MPAYERALSVPAVTAARAWDALQVRAGTDLDIPGAFLVLIALFVLGQSLIDRRDPKMVGAPKSSNEDTVGFE